MMHFRCLRNDHHTTNFLAENFKSIHISWTVPTQIVLNLKQTSSSNYLGII